ncbi:MAG: ATP-binding protein, partial [Edaphobacter sp.]
RIRVRVLGNWIYLTIADKGSGISREHLHHIFEPFFSTKKNSGTGLGLWLTNQIVQKHGGSIRVRSSNGTEQHGTVMRLSLPAAEIANRFNGSEQHLKYRSL